MNRDLLASKLADLSDRVGRVRSHGRPTVAELAADRDALDLVAFNLMLAVQTCADIASHLIADERWP
ncbi:MAG: type VII toxin-antitoxin system HepT family RNase toxin, partial [Polyangiaceae bacterium]